MQRAKGVSDAVAQLTEVAKTRFKLAKQPFKLKLPLPAAGPTAKRAKKTLSLESAVAKLTATPQPQIAKQRLSSYTLEEQEEPAEEPFRAEGQHLVVASKCDLTKMSSSELLRLLASAVAEEEKSAARLNLVAYTQGALLRTLRISLSPDGEPLTDVRLAAAINKKNPDSFLSFSGIDSSWVRRRIRYHDRVLKLPNLLSLSCPWSEVANLSSEDFCTKTSSLKSVEYDFPHFILPAEHEDSGAGDAAAAAAAAVDDE